MVKCRKTVVGVDDRWLEAAPCFAPDSAHRSSFFQRTLPPHHGYAVAVDKAVIAH